MRRSLILAASLLWGSVPMLAQVFPFTLSVQQGQNVTPIANGQALGISSPAIGQAVTFSIDGVYVGATTALFTSPAQLVGSPDFTIGALTPFPGTLNPGNTFKLTLTYKPTATVAAAQLTIPFAQSTASGTPTPGTLTFTLNGASASLSVNYFSAPSNNITTLTSGATIAFPATLVNTTSPVTVVIANAGAAAGIVNSVTLTGSSKFQLQSLGLLPAGVASGGSFSFGVIYNPGTAVGNDTGTLTIQFPTGPFVVNLTASSISPNLVYVMTNGTTDTTLTVGQVVTLPDTTVGSSTAVTIQVQNTGTAPTTIANISNTGAAYSLTDLPLLPVTITPNSSISFTLNFTPTTASVASGTLTIGGTRFSLTGTGLGSLLTYAYTIGSGTSTQVPAAGTVLFPSLPLAKSTPATLTVTNAGTTPTNLTSVGISTGATSAAFSVSNLPALPATLAPKASVTFTVTFTPVVSGLNSATLLINATPLTLSGFGTSAPPLPSYQITGASGTVQPSTQPSVGLTLSQGYPLDLTGVLTLSVTSSVFSADPAVQFATGGRTVPFTIPANTTNAVFSNGSQAIQFQTGTVAENIDFSATFATSGGVNVTPTTGSPLVLTVPQLAPKLLSVQISSVSATNLTLIVEGYSTTRSLGKLNFQFSSLSPTFALNSASSTFSIDVSQSSGFWYASTASQPFGSEFAITYPFAIQVNNPSGGTLPTLVNNIAVSVTATNSIGTSNSVSSQ